MTRKICNIHYHYLCFQDIAGYLSHSMWFSLALPSKINLFMLKKTIKPFCFYLQTPVLGLTAVITLTVISWDTRDQYPSKIRVVLVINRKESKVNRHIEVNCAIHCRAELLISEFILCIKEHGFVHLLM